MLQDNNEAGDSVSTPGLEHLGLSYSPGVGTSEAAVLWFCKTAWFLERFSSNRGLKPGKVPNFGRNLRRISELEWALEVEGRWGDG